MEERSIFQSEERPANTPQPLPNATAVLVLGILSIVLCFVGIVLSIIALVLAGKDMKMYRLSPEFYTNGSYSNLKAGRTCAIIGLILNAILVVVYGAVIVFAISTGFTNWRN